MMHAYDEIFLDDAMETLGSCFEYAVLVANIEGEQFMQLFNATDFSTEFARGNVKYISGMSGIELCRAILNECGMPLPKETTINHIDYSAEYWIGWILAYYQWYSGKSFSSIFKILKFDMLYNLYGVLHESDPRKAVDIFDNIMKENKISNLSIQRKNKGLTQEELASLSGVSIRSIQLYEQKANDINHAKYHHLISLSKVLGCTVDDILE